MTSLEDKDKECHEECLKNRLVQEFARESVLKIFEGRSLMKELS